MDKDPTTSVDDPSVDADTSTTDTDPTGTGPGTDESVDTPDPSKSDDTTVADGDKTPPAKDDSAAKDDTPAPLDADLDDWIEKKGLAKPENDAQKQAFQDMRNEQREFTRERQAKKDSEILDETVKSAKDKLKTDDDDDDLDPLEKRQNKIEADIAQERTARLQSEFYMTQKVTPEEHKAILDIFKEKVDTQPTDEAKLRAVDIWGSPQALPDLLDIARARLAKDTDTSAVETEAARKERERIAKESNSKSAGRTASVTTTSDKTEDEARLERFAGRFNKK